MGSICGLDEGVAFGESLIEPESVPRSRIVARFFQGYGTVPRG
jgi:hypothetical protein